MARQPTAFSAPERIFVDSSVVVALVALEEGRHAFTDRIAQAAERFTSAAVIVESTLRLASLLCVDPSDAEQQVRAALAELRIATAAIDDRTATLAVDAFRRFGKGRHPARLNFGDCLSYACARQHGLALLYKGDDFAQTDLG